MGVGVDVWGWGLTWVHVASHKFKKAVIGRFFEICAVCTILYKTHKNTSDVYLTTIKDIVFTKMWIFNNYIGFSF